MKKWMVLAISLLCVALVGLKIYTLNANKPFLWDFRVAATMKGQNLAVRKADTGQEKNKYNNDDSIDPKGYVLKKDWEYGKKIEGTLQTVINYPKVEVRQIDSSKVVQITVPYMVSIPPFMHDTNKMRFKRNMGDLVRIKAGGNVWQSEPAKSVFLSEKIQQKSGTVQFQMPIQDGYSEESLKKFTVNLIDPTGTNTSSIYTFK